MAPQSAGSTPHWTPASRGWTVGTVTTPIEDYALLSDRRTAALVATTGEVDWYCPRRFDADAVFAALLGNADNGRWSLRIAGGEVISREYVEDSFVLRTRWHTPGGEAIVTDCLARGEHHSMIRRVECVQGSVDVVQDVRFRFDTGTSRPWLQRVPEGASTLLLATSGGTSLTLRGPALTAGHERHYGTFAMTAGDRLAWVLTCHPSYESSPDPLDADAEITLVTKQWQDWAQNYLQECALTPVRRSLLVLRALTHELTGGVVAAATTSLPETPGGTRNWDYRYAWLRDSALTIEVMADHGDGGLAWRTWLLRAIAGDPHRLHIMYTIDGSRVAAEREVDLPGYGGARPVRVGNDAAEQYQGDVVGEVMMALAHVRELGVKETRHSWSLQRQLLDFQRRHCDDRGHGIWEMRGEPQFFTHSRVLTWAAFAQGVRAVEEHGLAGPVEAWRELRDRLRQEIDSHGYDAEIGSFVQAYGSQEVDASLLVLPLVGYLSADDPRMLGTVARIEADLATEDGFLRRYRTTAGLDGLPGEEYPFVICSFWLVQQYAASGRVEEARTLFDRLLTWCNDLGLLAEEYDPVGRRMMSNYPQAFSHLGLIRAAQSLHKAGSLRLY